MYITADTIIKAAAVLSALAVLVGSIVAVYKVLEIIKRQNAEINSINTELTVICYALQGALQGLIEQGCDGPCKDALNALQKHINKTAHRPDA